MTFVTQVSNKIVIVYKQSHEISLAIDQIRLPEGVIRTYTGERAKGHAQCRRNE